MSHLITIHTRANSIVSNEQQDGRGISVITLLPMGEGTGEGPVCVVVVGQSVVGEGPVCVVVVGPVVWLLLPSLLLLLASLL